MNNIKEFQKEYIEENSQETELLFNDFLNSQEPYASIFKNNPWLKPPNLKEPLQSGDYYWNTTVGRKHPFWKNKKLPSPTKDIKQIRKDLSVIPLENPILAGIVFGHLSIGMESKANKRKGSFLITYTLDLNP